MPVGERIKRQLEEKEIRKEQERLQLIRSIETTSEKLNEQMTKEARPLLEVLEKTGLYEMFKDIRRTFNLEWERKFRKKTFGCLGLIPALIGSMLPVTDRDYNITPAILTVFVEEKDGNFFMISEEGLIREAFDSGPLFVSDGGFLNVLSGEVDEETSLKALRKRASYLGSKKITIESCSLKLKWGLEYYVGGRDDEQVTSGWNQLAAEVVRDKKSRLFLMIKAGSSRYDRVSLRLTPKEWQDRKKVEEAVAKVYLEAFPQ